MPKGGRADDIILCEDQLLMGKWQQKQQQQKSREKCCVFG